MSFVGRHLSPDQGQGHSDLGQGQGHTPEEEIIEVEAGRNNSFTIMVRSFQTDRPGETVQAQIRLLLEVLHCLQCCLQRCLFFCI